MKLPHIAIILVTAAALAAPAPAAAQAPVTSFDQLNTRLKPGDTIWVTDAQGREVKGRINSLAPDSLGVDAGGFRTFAAGEVSIIQLRQGDSLGNGALIGLAVGGARDRSRLPAGDGRSGPGLVPPGRARLRRHRRGHRRRHRRPHPRQEAWRIARPARPAPSDARLSIAPVITPRAKGVAVSFAF